MIEISSVSGSTPGRVHWVAAGLSAALVVVVAVAGACFGAVPWPANPGFPQACAAGVALADLFAVALLAGRARAAARWDTAWLMAAYGFAALTLAVDLISPPTAGWLWPARHVGFAVGVAAFAATAPGGKHLPVMVAGAVLAAATLAYLWQVAVGGSDAPGMSALACTIGALVLVIRRPARRSVIAQWLAVALLTSCAEIAFGLAGFRPFTLGWYLGPAFGLYGSLGIGAALLLNAMSLLVQVFDANRHLERLSMTDPLTMLPNRRAFEHAFQTEWRRAMREKQPVSVLMVDIDQFKAFNDRLGHPAGDECLRVVGQTMAASVRRPSDLAARLGGEEFALLLPNTDRAGAALIGERLRAAIAALRIESPGAAGGIVTVSVGAAMDYPHGSAAVAATLLSRADTALYDAKRGGRNRVQLAEPDPAMNDTRAALAWHAADTVKHANT